MLYSGIPNQYSGIPNSEFPIPNSSGPPRWARALDLLCLTITLVSLIIAVSGGFRIRIGDARVALTSPWRLFV